MIFFSKKNKNSGFTLLELMVVIAIVGILVSIAIVNSGKNPDRDVRLEKDRLVSYLRSVQNKALTGERVSGFNGKICGFGVRDTGGYLQAYYVGNSSQDAICSSMTGNTGTDLSSSTEAFRAQIPDVTISLDNGATSLFFLSPSGEPFLNGASFPAIFTLEKGDASATVTVEKSGIIR